MQIFIMKETAFHFDAHKFVNQFNRPQSQEPVLLHGVQPTESGRDMNYYARRLAMGAITIFTTITISFILVRLMPGGPQEYLIGNLVSNGMDVAQARELASDFVGYEVDAPLHVQYFNYMGNIITGDFGQSIWFDQSVRSIFLEALPWTVLISGIALFGNFLIGVAVGAFLAYREGTRLDVNASSFMIVASSVPYYVVALLLLIFLSLQFDLFPAAGRYNTDTVPGFNYAFLAGVLHHAALPVLSLMLFEWGETAISMRSNAVRILGEPYLRVARLRGLPTNRIALRYVSRNAMLPLFTGLMIRVGFILGGSIITERIFGYRGVGFYMFEAISARDFQVLMGGLIIITVAVVIGVLLADLTYGYIDPRAGKGADRESY